MTPCELKFRNQLATNLTQILVEKNSPDYQSETLIDHAFELADLVTARIAADCPRNTQPTQSAQSASTQQVQSTHPLRRADDKVEVKEISSEQALDMIMSLFLAAKH